nr:hypothetical protein [Massilia sp. PDC64]
MIVVHELPGACVLQQNEERSAWIVTDYRTIFRELALKLSLPELEIDPWLEIESE